MLGLIVADGANMALRVLYCLWFIAHNTAAALPPSPDVRYSSLDASPAAMLTSFPALAKHQTVASMQSMNENPASCSNVSGTSPTRRGSVAGTVTRLWHDLTPSSASLLSLFLAAVALQTSGWVTGWAHAQVLGMTSSGSLTGSVAGLLGAAIHIGAGAMALLGVFYSVWKAEKPLWQSLKSLQGPSRQVKKHQ